MTYRQPEKLEQALVEAFYLGLIAPGDGETRAARLLAARFGADLDANTIAVCRAAARERFEAEETDLR